MKDLIFILAILVFGCQPSPENKASFANVGLDNQSLDTATFAGGCFWCIEASFEQIKGVKEAVSGYAGGSKENATYRKVSYGLTRHTETVQIYYDPEVIDYNTLLDIFFTAHDPTQLNRQGPDVGTQYRSAIFYHNKKQRELAEKKIEELSPNFEKRIVTELNRYTEFFEAEAYHQDYEKRNPNQPYVVSVSRPKVERVANKFKHLLKENMN
jgi:peptide-methionine (S)-S-oxide reductase